MYDPVEDAAQLLRNESLNVGIEFVLTEDGDTLFNMRATYWRNNVSSERMYLVAQTGLEDALILLAYAVENRLWSRVDWRARLYRPGCYGHANVSLDRPHAPETIDSPSKPRLVRGKGNPTNDPA